MGFIYSKTKLDRLNISKKAKMALERLGMSVNEIKVYAALLNLGNGTAEEISKESEVSYSKIYKILNSMENESWIISDDSRPTTYTVISPATSIEAVKRKRDAEFKDDKTVITLEIEPLYNKTGTAETPDILFLRGVNSIISKILDTADSCDREMMITVPAAGQEIVKQALPKLRILYDRGVEITILTSEEMDDDSIKALSRVATVRIKDSIYGGGMISDKRYVIILLGSDDGKSFTANMVAIWADHVGLAGFAREYFEYLMKDSEDV
ncbi:MAG: transcriptional regulator TrmB [Cenarchaeum symbiont of Oopsacas minuta]|nr:transcriptional regulator TrmB [Cenarchaeum symbiont of Oopsacas minuta]